MGEMVKWQNESWAKQTDNKRLREMSWCLISKPVDQVHHFVTIAVIKTRNWLRTIVTVNLATLEGSHAGVLTIEEKYHVGNF
jgi:hypothetical protein